jgi:glucuronoarabinoxylan endo-1,4-beta-xylanase
MFRFTCSKCLNPSIELKGVQISFSRFSKKLFVPFVVWILNWQVYASVSIVQNLGANWVGSPTIMTASSPLTSKEGNWGSSAPYSLGQSFTAPVSGVLTNIQLYGSGRTTANILLYLYDMGPAIQYASQPSSVVSGSNSVTTVVSGNLFSTNLAITVVSTASDQVMQLTFSGADAVPLIGGHEYMFTMVSTNSSPMYWDDGGSNPYPGGAAYRQNSFINGGSTTDFSLAVTLINTNAGPTIYDCVVDWNNVHQRIDGFGASSAWRSTWTASEADMFFSTNSGTGTSVDGKTNFSFNGVGLSLLRSRVNTNGIGTYESSIMQMAQARGAKVWSTPWSPPPQFKDNNNVNGGNFLSANNQAYAGLLAKYVVNMKSTYGVNIYALSIQNEPDVSASYESCQWTAQQFHDFVPYLQSALVASNVASTQIILAEDEHWQTNYYYTAMSDPATATNVSIVACHNYDGSPATAAPAALPAYANTNAALWETEVSKLSGNGAFDPSMSDAIYWAGRIHQFMTLAQVNAWHYWWLISNNPDNEGLADTNGIPAKRMYVLGQYSRFVRPNNYRMDLANYNPYAVLGSAYQDPVSGNFAIVISNTNNAATTQSFYLTNFTATTVTPWITSSNLSLAAQTAVTLTNSTFSYLIPGMSVVTFVGTALTNGPVSPYLTPVPDQMVNPGTTLLVTNAAVDANVPPLKLTFTLLNGPTNATLTSLTSTSALFSWTPLPSQANTTNLITVIVADNGTPSLSTTNSFNVIVNTNNGIVPTSTTLSSSTNNAAYGTLVTFTATVTPAPTNGETVTFLANGSAIGTGVLYGGVASYTTAANTLNLSGSPYTVTATYGGDGYYQPSASVGLSQTITPTTLMITSGLNVLNKVYDGTTTATITSNNISLFGVVAGDAGNVNLSTNGSTALFASKNVGNGIAVAVNGLTLSGSAATNYILSPPGLSANIMPALVTLVTSSGSLKITNNFTSGNNQFEVYNGQNGFSPALNGSLYTNFQCDLRFAPGSATQTNSSGVVVFGHLQFGTRTNSNQDYFGGSNYGIDVPATNTGWVHVSIPISVATDPNLASINDLLIHIYGPYGTTLVGPSTLWVDNLAFVGPTNKYIIDQFNPAGVGGNSYSGGNIGNVWGNWFGASWVANIWDSTNDAIGITANDKIYDGTTNATINLYDTLINPALSGVLSGDSTNVWLSTNGYTAFFANAGPGSNLTVTVSGLTLVGSAGSNYIVAPLTLTANISQGIQQTPLISIVPAASAITYGQTLASSTLSGGVATNAVGAAVNGSFVFTTPAMAPGAGTQSVSVTFVPTDNIDYFATTASVPMTVNPQTPVVSLAPTASAITYGQTLTNSTLSGGVATNMAGAAVDGSFAFTVPSTAPGTGVQSELVTFTPTDTVNYLSTSASVSVSVSLVTITVTADNQGKTTGLPNPMLTATYSGFVNGEDTNVLTALASLVASSDVNSPAGVYSITPSGASAANYTFNYVPGTLTVVAQPQMAGVNTGVSGFALTFPTLVGQMYQVEYKTNLTDTTWTPVGDPIPGTGNSMSVTNNSGATQGFYMLQIFQP